MERTPWWKGARGEWYVCLQVALMVLVFFGPRSIGGWPESRIPFRTACLIVGWILLAAGMLLFLSGGLRLGRNLTPFPRPKDDATLVETGAYALVRHPLYGGGALLAVGFALVVRSWLVLIYAAVLVVFIDFKSRREEAWLRQKFPAYADYQRRVRRLIPFLY